MQMLFRVEVEVRLEEEIIFRSWWICGVGYAIAKNGAAFRLPAPLLLRVFRAQHVGQILLSVTILVLSVD